MYEKYAAFGGVEVLNAARTGAYIKAFMPGAEVLCDDAALAVALRHSAYTSPKQDNAPWHRSNRPATARFYGLYPSRIQGAEDSTREIHTTELLGPGAVTTSPRHGSREIRIKASAYAADEEAMDEGIAWLRDVLADDGCSDEELGCTGQDLQLFAALPSSAVAAHGLSRYFYDTEVTVAPKVLSKSESKRGGLKWDLEWVFTCGTPWAFTAPTEVGFLALDEGSNFQDPDGENCGTVLDPYELYVDDPYFAGISKPPKPPTILPPNLLNISSWRRRTLALPSSTTGRWGRTVPKVTVLTENAVQFVRLRFYETGKAGCDFEGEFLISYLPASSILTLDAARRKATLQLSSGHVIPAGHLLFGSGGRPFLWPTLGCQRNYTMTADIMPGNPGVAVQLNTAVRE